VSRNQPTTLSVLGVIEHEGSASWDLLRIAPAILQAANTGVSRVAAFPSDQLNPIEKSPSSEMKPEKSSVLLAGDAEPRWVKSMTVNATADHDCATD
jgi:hypothetical protein